MHVPLKEDLKEVVAKILREQWSTREGKVVPEPEDLELGNDAIGLDATILYADIDGSTQLVDYQKSHLAAEVYKTYIVCAASIVKDEGGTIAAYDGDRVMGIFIGESKNTTAARQLSRLTGR